ncbi:MAG: DNA internalization-related competence protein ComEC/Rec2 [Gammaproteobacteria bacterium]|nr:DNA internalization-related competence protein ComEC/Rec2 [Gammaproteobacteria bacterium]
MYFVYSLAFLFGTLSLYYYPVIPNVWLLLLLALYLSVVYKKSQCFIFIIIYLISLSWASFNYYQISHQKWLLEQLFNHELLITGRVASLENNKLILFKVISVKNKSSPEAILYLNIYLKLYFDNKQNISNLHLKKDQKLLLSLKLRARNMPRNFIAQEDKSNYYLREFARPIKVKTENFIQENVAPSIREKLWDNCLLYSDKLVTKGIILALIFGERYYLTDQQWQIFTSTGTGHLIAISGMHIALVFYLIFGFSKYLWRVVFYKICQQESSCLIVAWLFTCFYGYISGFSIPTQRALIALSIYSGAKLLKLKLSSWNVFGICLIAVLIYDPLAVLTASFWLSFNAALCLLYLYSNRFELKYGVKSSKNILLNKFYKIFYGFIVANIESCMKLFLALIPVGVFYFNRLSLTSILANIIAIPAISFIILPSLIMSLILIIFNLGAAASFFINGVDYLLIILIKYLEYLSSNYYLYINNYGLILIIIIVFLLLAPRGLPTQSLIIYFSFLYYFDHFVFKYKTKDKLTIDVLDVGQGLSVIVNTKYHQLLYDTGPKLNYNYIADKVVSNILLDYKSYVDAIVISHWDADHSANLLSITHNIKSANIASLYSSDLVSNDNFSKKFAKIKTKYCNSNYSWTWDNVEFKFLATNEGNTEYFKNNSSCILKVTYNNFSVLLTGDIESKTELNLVNRHKNDLKSDILLVPHHGSKTSSNLEFIRQVSPKYALISLGIDNIYNHPSQEVIARYKKLGIKLYRTDQQGGIKILINNDIIFKTAKNN